MHFQVWKPSPLVISDRNKNALLPLVVVSQKIGPSQGLQVRSIMVFWPLTQPQIDSSPPTITRGSPQMKMGEYFVQTPTRPTAFLASWWKFPQILTQNAVDCYSFRPAIGLFQQRNRHCRPPATYIVARMSRTRGSWPSRRRNRRYWCSRWGQDRRWRVTNSVDCCSFRSLTANPMECGR